VELSRRPWQRADLRVGDADRQAVVAELQQHYIEGRLTSEELGERVAQALAARTFGDLSDLLADLPTPPPANTPSQSPEHGGLGDVLGSPAGAILVLVGIMLLLTLVVLPMTRGGGMFFPWPLLIWGFFFVGRPHHGGRHRW